MEVPGESLDQPKLQVTESFDEAIITNGIRALFVSYMDKYGSLTAPTNLKGLAEFCRVLEIKETSMIPEGVLTPVPHGFVICLQKNFLDSPGALVRQRFTLAHELTHTFFYDVRSSTPVLRPDAPQESESERLSHAGAARLLMPESLLAGHLKSLGGVSSADQVVSLSAIFGTSPETTMRRAQQMNAAQKAETAVLLVNTSRAEAKIAGVCFGPWLAVHSPILPKIGSKFDFWIARLLPAGAEIGLEWTRLRSDLEVRRVMRADAKSSYFIELRGHE